MRSLEVPLLVLPVVLLGAGGWYVSQWSTPRTKGPLRVVLDEVKVVPVNPVEFYQGYDTKVVVKAHSEGQLPQKPGWEHNDGDHMVSAVQLVAIKNRKEQILFDAAKGNKKIFSYMSVDGWGEGAERDGGAVYWLKMSALPKDIGEVKIKSTLTRDEQYIVNSGYKIVKSRPTPLEITVKRADEVFVPPTISRYRPFHLVEKAVRRTNYGLDHSGRTRWGRDVFIIIRLSEELKSSEVQVNVSCGGETPHAEAFLTDAEGRRYTKVIDDEGKTQRIESKSLITHFDQDVRRYVFKLPPMRNPTGRLTLHSTVYVDDYWPMPVEVLMREK
jgi:hypothetical protein